MAPPLYSLFIALLFIVISCNYEPEGLNPVEIEKTPKAGLKTYALEEQDTLFIFKETYVDYHFVVSEGNFYEFKVFIEDEEIYNSREKIGSFRLGIDDYPTGVYSMRYEIYTSSGTNSLADIAGGEQLFFRRELVVIFDQDPLPKPFFLSIDKNEKGHLVVKWKKIHHYFFKQYLLRRIRGSYDNGENTRTYEFTHSSDTFFIDSLYFGGIINYELAWESLKKEFPEHREISEYKGAQYEEGLPEIVSFKTTEGHKLLVQWSKTNYPDDFSSYTLRLKENNQILFRTTDPDDTSFVIESPVNFGGEFEATLVTSPLGEEEGKELYSTTSTLFFGEKTKFTGELPADGEGFFYTSYGNYLYKLNSRLDPVDSLEGIVIHRNFTVSALNHDGSYLYYYDFSTLNRNTKTVIRIINTQTFIEEREIDLKSFFPDRASLSLTHLVPQGNHDFYFHYRDDKTFETRLGYYNAQENAVYSPEQASYYSYSAFGNIQNKVVYSNDYVVEGFTLFGRYSPLRQRIKDYGCGIFSIPGKSGEFALTDNTTQKLEIYSFTDFRKKQEFPLPGLVSKTRLSGQGNVVVFAVQEDMRSFAYLMEFRTSRNLLKVDLFENNNDGSHPNSVYFSDGWLYSSSGYKMDIRNLLP